MVLDPLKISEEIKSPSKSRQIKQAIAQQDRIKFHSDTTLDIAKSVPYQNFKAFIASLLPEDKFLVTMNLLKFPVPTNKVTESVFVKLSKIFDGRNPAINYQFHNTQERDDWEWYRQDVLNEPNVWAEKAWEYFKTEINCVMVVDMPSEADPTDRYPQPYFYFVPISSVISYSVNRQTENMDWIIFKSDERIIVIDGETYRTYSWSRKGGLGAEPLSVNPHGLGYCPARFFWNESLSLATPDVKKSPLSKELSDLDWYLFYSLGKRHLDLYGSYPILSGYEEECDYSDAEGNMCHKGHLQKPDGSWLTDINGNIKECPLCHAKKNLAGAGTYVDVPIPAEGQPDLRNPIQMLTIDKASLSYNVEEVERLKSEIINACVGVDNTILNETSLADKQVDASFESRESVLNRIKRGFENAQQWVDTTICKLRYGSAFINAKINYGNEFYTLTPEVLRKRYSAAKESGASDSELEALRQQLIETEYRHNPNMLQRMLILSDIEPFTHLSKSEVNNLLEKGMISRAEAILKNDFTGFIRRFERENDNILEFGSMLEYSEKIKRIKDTLLGYAEEQLPRTNDSNQE